ncbi:Hypothetical predicted protein [Paramuricea clavata]|uniref:Uncharacterized protein n=1 Tax=Paramuricea clavata TaxID=317549 RepID=A0A6S7ITI2_PARCT|nr:Hypothetical predicted protein [Paramuricea clavata]
MRSEPPTNAPLSRNKHSFKRYLSGFPEGQSVIALKAEERAKKTPSTSSQKSDAPVLLPESMSPDVSDADLLASVIEIESSSQTSSPGSISATPPPASSEVNLIEGWKSTLPKHDHQWVSSALFKVSNKGKPVFDSAEVNQLWYYPPQPSLIPTQPPSAARYFARRLLLWMPRKMWKEASDVMKSKNKPSGQSQNPDEVRKQALKAVKDRNGDVGNDLDVKGEYVMQFGNFRGQTFRWLLDNALGYVAWLINSIRGETTTTAAISQNKSAFREYAMSFEACRDVVAEKKDEMDAKLKKTRPTPPAPKAGSPLARRLASGQITNSEYLAKVSKEPRFKFAPTIPPSTRVRPSTSSPSKSVEIGDTELCDLVAEIEKKLESPVNVSAQKEVEQVVEQPSLVDEVPASETTTSESSSNVTLPDGWLSTLPKADHQWIAQALFKANARTGKAELDFGRVNKLWWYLPQPPLIASQPPRPSKLFSQRLLLWMPRKLWGVKLHCPHPTCEKKELTGAGIDPRIRQVLDIDNLAAEYLECRACKKKVISWSPAIVRQLDPGHQLQFPVLITYQYACDVKVIRLLRQRSLGNSSTVLQKKMSEQHGEKWLQKSIQYLTECKYFAQASKSGLILAKEFEEPPKFVPVPKYKWFLTVYVQDIMSRIDHIKASITSTFGRVIKMDSTKKIVKKLAGQSSGTASWATNVGNEMGQVLMSVLTASEGVGLAPMVNGLMKRYSTAGVPQPRRLRPIFLRLKYADVRGHFWKVSSKS